MLAAAVQRLLYWRRLALKVDTDLEADLAEYFGLTAAQSRLLARLYRAGGEWVRTWDLAVHARITDRSVGALVADMRQALECEAIDSTRGIPGGYRLTEIGLSECETAFRSLGALPPALQHGEAA